MEQQLSLLYFLTTNQLVENKREQLYKILGDTRKHSLSEVRNLVLGKLFGLRLLYCIVYILELLNLCQTIATCLLSKLLPGFLVFHTENWWHWEGKSHVRNHACCKVY